MNYFELAEDNVVNIPVGSIENIVDINIDGIAHFVTGDHPFSYQLQISANFEKIMNGEILTYEGYNVQLNYEFNNGKLILSLPEQWRFEGEPVIKINYKG